MEKGTKNIRNERVLYAISQCDFIKIKNILLRVFACPEWLPPLFILYKNANSFISRSEPDFRPWCNDIGTELDITETLSKTDMTELCLIVHTSACTAVACLLSAVLSYPSLLCCAPESLFVPGLNHAVPIC